MANMTHAQAAPTLKAAGCPDADVQATADLATLPGFSFATLLALVAQYGPQILTVILALFGKTPVPSPLPPLLNKP